MLIQGLALSPSAFAKYSSSKTWDPKLFALPAPNANTTWSNGGDNNDETARPWSRGFDGVIMPNSTYDTYTRPANTSTAAVWTAPGDGIAFSTLRILGCRDGSNAANQIIVNGVTTTGFNSNNTHAWNDLSSQITSPLTTIKLNPDSGQPRFMAVEVDGKILIDGSSDPTTRTNPNDGTAWSSSGTWAYNNAVNSGNEAAKGFDGNLGTFTANQYSADGYLEYTFPSAVTVNKKLEVHLWLADTNETTMTQYYTVNSESEVTMARSNPDGPANDWRTLKKADGSQWTGSLTKLKLRITRSDGNTNNNLYAIRIDGHVLIDSSVDNSFHLNFSDTSLNRYLGKDTLNGKIANATGGLPIYKTSDDYGDVKGSGYNSEASNTIRDALVLAVPGDSVASGTCDVHQQINTGSSNKAVTTNGSIAVKTDQSRLYGSSLYFDDSDDYINFADDADWDISTGDYCIEAWVRWETVANDETILGCYAGNNAWQVFTGNGGAYPAFQIRQSDNTYKEVYSSTVVAANQWYHLACTVEGTNIKLYLNGILKGTTAFSGTVKDCDQVVQIGSRVGGTSNKFNGWINDLRIYKGTAKYTANFTPPTRNDFTVNNLEATTYSTFAPAGPIYKTADKDDGFSDDSLKQYLRFACPCNEGDGTLDMNDYHATIKGSGYNHSVTATGWTSDSPSSDTGWGV